MKPKQIVALSERLADQAMEEYAGLMAYLRLTGREQDQPLVVRTVAQAAAIRAAEGATK